MTPPATLDRSGYSLEVEDRFTGPQLREPLWVPYYLPHWAGRDRSAARYRVDRGLALRIDADQGPWSPDLDGAMRVSSLQTGVFSGPAGSPVGQHRFRDGLVVREPQDAVRNYTPQYGLFELRARALDDPAAMVALWMIGYEDEPDRSAEICICEIFGSDVDGGTARVGMGLHPFGDPSIRDDFEAVELRIDARQPHDYAAEWTPERVAFYVDERLVRVVDQSPAYPMQFMLGIYEFRDRVTDADAGRYPLVFEVEAFRGYRPTMDRSRGRGYTPW